MENGRFTPRQRLVAKCNACDWTSEVKFGEESALRSAKNHQSRLKHYGEPKVWPAPKQPKKIRYGKPWPPREESIKRWR